ncbi:MAG TPA: hypothetical protein VHZ81_08620 [Galbitalea sp.]|jgi:hypothetical protein|nr:hypothetical protein [Galbitalea sp.]
MTNARAQAPVENILAGSILALLAIPVGVILLVLLGTVGIVASIVGFAVSFAALWLYRRASGGIISRVGAWIVTLIVLASLLLGIWASMVVDFAGGLGHLGTIGLPDFWNQFDRGLPTNINWLFVLLVLAFGALGAFRILRRAFATAHVPAHPGSSYGSHDSPTGNATAVAPTVYQNDVDAPPTGSADDKTPPPSLRS